MSKTITIIGNVGTGKTTLAKVLAQKLPAELINGDPFESNPFLPLYARDHARWALATELYFTLSRAKHLSSELKKHQDKTKIIDSGLLMGIDVYAKHHLAAGTLSHEEWFLFKRFAKSITTPDLIYPDIVIYCHSNIKTSLSRIKSRGRTFEAHHSRAYLTNLERSLNSLILKLKRKNIQVLNFDSAILDPRRQGNIDPILKELRSLLSS